MLQILQVRRDDGFVRVRLHPSGKDKQALGSIYDKTGKISA